MSPSSSGEGARFGGGLFWRRRHHRVAPHPSGNHQLQLIEIRPGRILRVIHLKPPPKENAGQQENGHSDGSSSSIASSQQNNRVVNGQQPPCQSTPPRTSSQASMVSSVMEDGNSVLFFIHGVGGSTDVWKGQLDHFAENGFELIAIDLIGHGFSNAPRNSSSYTFDEISLDILTVFDKYSKKRNVLIGHSYGASFCALLAQERRSKVTKLIMVSGGGPLPLEPVGCQITYLPNCCLDCFKPFIVNGFIRRAFHHIGTSQTVKDKNQSFDIPSYVFRAIMNGQYWPEGDEDYHASINVGAMLIYGCEDQLVSLEDTLLMYQVMYGSQLEKIEGTGHMVMMEKPDVVNKLIHDFILKDMQGRMARPDGHGNSPQATPRHYQRRNTKVMPFL